VDGQLTVRAPWKTVMVFENTLSMPSFSSKTSTQQPIWDGDFVPDGTEVDLVVTVVTCHDFTRHNGRGEEHSGQVLGINTLVLLLLEANPGFHMRVGAFFIESEFQEDLIPRTELEAFGLNVIDEDFRNISVDEESSLRTFKLI